MRLKYLFEDEVIDAGPAKFEEEWYDKWLRYMVNSTDDVIFFLTVETSDVDVPGFI